MESKGDILRVEIEATAADEAEVMRLATHIWPPSWSCSAEQAAARYWSEAAVGIERLERHANGTQADTREER